MKKFKKEFSYYGNFIDDEGKFQIMEEQCDDVQIRTVDINKDDMKIIIHDEITTKFNNKEDFNNFVEHYENCLKIGGYKII